MWQGVSRTLGGPSGSAAAYANLGVPPVGLRVRLLLVPYPLEVSASLSAKWASSAVGLDSVVGLG